MCETAWGGGDVERAERNDPAAQYKVCMAHLGLLPIPLLVVCPANSFPSYRPSTTEEGEMYECQIRKLLPGDQSLTPPRDHRINLRGSPRRSPTRQRSDAYQQFTQPGIPRQRQIRERSVW